jgi:predicted amino acid racemase
MMTIELGELREGVMRENVINFYWQVFDLPNIEVVSLGANLSCLFGVLPNTDKLIQFCLYKQLIEAAFNKKRPYVLGGSPVTIPLILKKCYPPGLIIFVWARRFTKEQMFIKMKKAIFWNKMFLRCKQKL